MNVQEVLDLLPRPEHPTYLEHYKRFIQAHVVDSPQDFIENHHIVPVSFGMRRDFKNQEWNGIKLRPRDHFVAHKLLWKAYGKSMAAAYFQMAKTRGLIVDAEDYEKLRIDFCERMKDQFKGKKRKPFTEEHKKRMAEAARRRPHKSHSEETKQKISESWNHRREVGVSIETRKKISGSKTGQKLSEETKQKIGDSQRGDNHWTRSVSPEDLPMAGKHHSEETKERMRLAQKGKPKGAHMRPCPFCGKLCQAGGSMKGHINKYHQAEVGAQMVSG